MKKLSILTFFTVILISFTACSKFVNKPLFRTEKDIGLVFSGGGAKGAYQIGVWRALDEFHLSERVGVVSGTSVGSLNAALFACGDWENARKLWENEVGFYSFLLPDLTNISDIVSYVQNVYESYLQLEDTSVSSEDSLSVLGKITAAFSNTFLAVADLTEYFLGGSHSGGLFTRDSLDEIIKKSISLESLKNSDKTVYVSALEKNFLDLKRIVSLLNNRKSVRYFKLNEQTSDEAVKELLLASSALPVAYPSVRLGSEIIYEGRNLTGEAEYIDGGFDLAGGANTPVEPVEYSASSRIAIVVYLQSEKELGKDGILKIRGKDKVINIIPSEDLGTIISGTVNFMNDKIDMLMELGYNDACRALKKAGF
ncbi:MAG: patatin-like phospholipase family protein [Treponema sp.]|nr:patatin-like phospholipase family protein [Treponema sp.]